MGSGHRGGEVKQFVRGGRAITLAGGGRSISESCLQMLDSIRRDVKDMAP